jgi:hypothetical protein
MKPLSTRKVGRPTTEKRDEIIQALLQETVEALPPRVKRLANAMHLDSYLFEERNFSGLSLACDGWFYELMELAVGAYMQGDPAAGASRLREAFANGYWSCELIQQNRLAKHIGYDAPDDGLRNRLVLHGLAAAGGAPQIADWLAPYLHNALKGGSVCGTLTADIPFRGFYEVVIDAHVSGAWPREIDHKRLRAYGDLLVAAGNADAFRKALVAWCDYRLAQSLGFDGMEAPKRRPASVYGLFDGGWMTLLPFELFSLKYVFERTTGKTLSLEADHPLLHVPHMQVPPVLPLVDDDYLRRVVALAEDVFGSQWKKLTPVAVL